MELKDCEGWVSACGKYSGYIENTDTKYKILRLDASSQSKIALANLARVEAQLANRKRH